MEIRVGDRLYGFCGGFFGSGSYSNKKVEAIGTDWVVAREVDNGYLPVFANVNPEWLIPYLSPEGNN